MLRLKKYFDNILQTLNAPLDELLVLLFIHGTGFSRQQKLNDSVFIV
jgi:hypothetical protein